MRTRTKTGIVIGLILLVLVSVFTGALTITHMNNVLHQDFRLRNCIDNNKLQLSGATWNAVMISKIESECACIHIQNYTNWLDECAGIEYT